MNWSNLVRTSSLLHAKLNLTNWQCDNLNLLCLLHKIGLGLKLSKLDRSYNLSLKTVAVMGIHLFCFFKDEMFTLYYLSLWMYASMYVCMYVRTSVCMYVRLYLRTAVCMSAFMSAFMSVCMCVNIMSVHIICIYVCMYAFVMKFKKLAETNVLTFPL